MLEALVIFLKLKAEIQLPCTRQLHIRIIIIVQKGEKCICNNSTSTVKLTMHNLT